MEKLGKMGMGTRVNGCNTEREGGTRLMVRGGGGRVSDPH
jgi:hypothetical protein